MERRILFMEQSPYPVTYAGIEMENIPRMTIDDYQLATNRQATYHENSQSPSEYLAYGFWAESVELSVHKSFYLAVLLTRPDPADIPSDVRMGMTFELGDMMWYLAQMAETEGTKLSEVALRQASERLLMPESAEELTLDGYQQLARLMPDVGTVENKWGIETSADISAAYLLARRASELVQSTTGLLPAHPMASTIEKHSTEEAIGNAFWMVAHIADRLDVPLSQVAAYNMAKLNSRMERGVVHGGEGDYR